VTDLITKGNIFRGAPGATVDIYWSDIPTLSSRKESITVLTRLLWKLVEKGVANV
jgi:hypothetical protein